MSEMQKHAKRTTRTAQKLALFPGENRGGDALSSQGSNEAAIQQIKLERKWLPRVTGYCTASNYKMDLLFNYLVDHGPAFQTAPKRFDEAIYTPISFNSEKAAVNPKTIQLDSRYDASGHIAVTFSDSGSVSPVPTYSSSTPVFFPSPHLPTIDEAKIIDQAQNENIPALFELAEPVASTSRVDTSELSRTPSRGSLSHFLVDNVDSSGHSLPKNLPRADLAKRVAPVGELIFFDYGVVVMWGLSPEEEKKILTLLEMFEDGKLSSKDIETEELHFHFNTSSPPRIYNDIITLTKGGDMIKLTISHAIAQSVKLALFEQRIEETISRTQHIPSMLSSTGKIPLSRESINQHIGQLFTMRMNVNLISNVLDTPEIFWSEPTHEPLYTVIRRYLEITQRADLLNQRTTVLSDLLEILKDQQNSKHGEKLEWIVILLISFEVVMGLIKFGLDWHGINGKSA